MPPLQGTDNGGTGYGVQGASGSAIGVEGVVGTSKTVQTGAKPVVAGVVGYGFDTGLPAQPPYGVYGSSISGEGVYGDSGGGNGVHGITGEGSRQPNPRRAGVWGDSDTTNGVYGSSAQWNGVEGDSWSSAHAGVAGQNNAGGPGIWGYSSGNAGQFEGNVLVTGNLTANDVMLSGADCAEDFDAQEASEIEAGAVVVFDQNGRLTLCDEPYDKRVAGVVSGGGSFRPGVILDRQTTNHDRVPLALVGKVYCKVDASFGSIALGDLLTTSAGKGCAMKAQDQSRAFGAIIGKALMPHNQGTGLIPILVMRA